MTNRITGPREALRSALRRPTLRASAGPVGSVAWDPDAARFDAAGPSAEPGQTLFVFVPGERHPPVVLERQGLQALLLQATSGGAHLALGWAEGGPWSLSLRVR